MIKWLVIALVLAASFAAFAEQPEASPKSVPARKAVDKYDKAIAAAEAAWHKAQIDAKQDLIIELEAAKKEAMKNQNLDEAVAIDALIKKTREELARIPKAGSVIGTWDVTFDYGGNAHYRIDENTIDNTDWKVKYERSGNELRFKTPSNESVRLVFNGDQFLLESWRDSPQPFKGKPTFTAKGKREP